MGFPSRDGAPSPPPLSPFLSFIFFPTCFWRQWSAFLVAWCPLPAYRSCFVEFAQRWNVLLRNLWGRKWSSHPIPPPSLQFLQNWCFWTIVLEKILESPLDCKKIKPVHPEGNQSLIFIGRTDAEAETPILWPPDVKNWLIWKDPDAEEDWRQEKKGTTEDEMVRWHHRLNGHEFG